MTTCGGRGGVAGYASGVRVWCQCASAFKSAHSRHTSRPEHARGSTLTCSAHLLSCRCVAHHVGVRSDLRPTRQPTRTDTRSTSCSQVNSHHGESLIPTPADAKPSAARYKGATCTAQQGPIGRRARGSEDVVEKCRVYIRRIFMARSNHMASTTSTDTTFATDTETQRIPRPL